MNINFLKKIGGFFIFWKKSKNIQIDEHLQIIYRTNHDWYPEQMKIYNDMIVNSNNLADFISNKKNKKNKRNSEAAIHNIKEANKIILQYANEDIMCDFSKSKLIESFYEYNACVDIILTLFRRDSTPKKYYKKQEYISLIDNFVYDIQEIILQMEASFEIENDENIEEEENE